MSDLIIPLHHSQVTLFRGPAVSFVDDLRIVKKLDDSDISLVYPYFQKIDGKIPRHRWVYVQNVDDKHKDKVILLEFLFNIFKQDNPIQIPWYFRKEGQKVAWYSYEPYLDKDLKKKFTIKTDPRTFKDFYKILCKTYAKNDAIVLSIQRFNKSLGRANLHDRIVDLAISLESLISGNYELTYRLSLFFAIISESDPTERQKVFTKIKKFYSARSHVVHGNSSQSEIKKYDNSQEWNDIVEIVKKALLYYIFFLAQKETKWEDHLLELALGSGNRII